MKIKFLPFDKLKQEINSLILITLPLTAAQITQFSISFVDSVMAGNVSKYDLAGVSVGSILWFVISVFIHGTLMALTPLVAQYYGAQKKEKVICSVQQGIWLALFLSLIGFLLLRYSEYFLIWMQTEAKTIPYVIGYIEGISWGLPAFAIAVAIRGYSEGLSHTSIILKLALFSIVINTIANYILIYGKLGFPAMGGPGCGWASSFALWLSLIILLFYIKKDPVLSSIPILKNFSAPNFSEIMQIVKIGLPIASAILAEVTAFSVVGIFLASVSAEVVSSHQIAINFASFVFMIPLSLSMGCTIRIGTHLGKNHFSKAKLTCICAALLVISIAICTSSIIYFFPQQIANLYSNDAEVITYAIHLLMFAAVFQIFDAAQVTLQGCLRGYKDTKMTMFINIISYWGIAVPVGYILGMTDYITQPMSATGFWIGLLSGLMVCAILLSIRLFYVIKASTINNEES